jgi:RNA-binding protein
VIHHITFRAFAAATEDEERVKAALSIFVPLDKINISTATGHFDNVIKILEATVRRREGLTFFELLREQLPEEERERLRQDVPRRMDEECELHLRLDKQAAYKGRVELTDSKDAIVASAHIETYPARYEDAVRIARELI